MLILALMGGAGPFFFDLDEWEHAIETCLRSAEVG